MRLAPFLLSLALLPAALTATATAAPDPADAPAGAQAREQRVRISLSASAAWVRKGDDVTLTGKVRGTRGRTTVTIFQKKLRPGSGWNVEARKRTTRKGAFRHSEDILTGHRMYKACAKGRCSQEVTVRMGTPPPPPAQPTSIGLSTTSASSVEAGAPFTVAGTAVRLDGQTVQVQAYDAGSTSWGSIGSAVVSNGQWVATASVSTAGRAVPVRAFFPGGAGLAAAASNETPITVFGWYYLYDTEYDGPVTEVASSYDEDYGPFTVNGVGYSKSVSLDGYTSYTTYVEYNLGRGCIRFASVNGLQDESNTVTRTTARIIVDSVTKWTQSGIQLGGAYPTTLDISGGLRLRLENTETTSGSGALVFGDARVLCAF